MPTYGVSQPPAKEIPIVHKKLLLGALAAASGPFRVVGSDIHRLDSDGDGIACES